MNRLGILVSGRGSNFLAIARAISEGRLPNCEIAVVISNLPDARALASAAELGLPALCIPSKGIQRDDHDRHVIAELSRRRVDLVCLAGYMRLLSPLFVAAFPRRILNIHPSLLPAFPGLHAQRQALEYGVKVSGCTVHFVDEHLDHGPIVLQATVPVLDDDTEDSLSDRILHEEHRIYTEAIALVLTGAWRLDGRRVRSGP
ncbi:MAG: phosphoribosylglycinamide formyltransferase [Bryobacteraceae bacterium]|nr:phosphoribosylglycinamide formyltransferase [Bryobacteraceae bacterium]